MFRGSSFHTIDTKGRIIIPARFRDVIKANGADSVMLSRIDNCVVAYTMEKWRRLEDEILSLPKPSARMRRFRRVFIGGAFECTCDKQDRILIPSTLRAYASGLTKILSWSARWNALKSGRAKIGIKKF
jgi:MraZ protein